MHLAAMTGMLGSIRSPHDVFLFANRSISGFIILIAIGIIGAIACIVLVVKTARKNRGTLPAPYSEERLTPLVPRRNTGTAFAAYADVLVGLSIGAGVPGPRVYAIRLPSRAPLAYCARVGAEQVGPTPSMDIILTTDLLEREFTRYEVEAIAACLLAKKVIFPKIPVPDVANEEAAAERVGLSQDILGKLRGILPGNIYPAWILIMDTWAVRLTGNPEALGSAIAKSVQMLEAFPVTVPWANPTVFVEPPHHYEYVTDRHLPATRYMGTFGYLAQVEDLGMVRDEMIQIRLRNLDMISLGNRQPFQRVQDGAPLTGPEGWE